MRFSTTALLVSGLAVHQAAATFRWPVDAPGYTCPDNTDNKCDDNQKSGFDWKDLSKGPFSKYKDFDFDGWSCDSKFGKRDLMSKRTFGSDCIKSPVTKSKGSKISCGSKNFSVKEFDVSVDIDTDIEIHYGMPDGSTCKQTASCKKSGTTIRNTQCGGAKEVTFQIPNKSKNEKCDLGIHKIDFDCDAPKPKPSTSTRIASTTTHKNVDKPTTTNKATTTAEKPSTTPVKPSTTPVKSSTTTTDDDDDDEETSTSTKHLSTTAKVPTTSDKPDTPSTPSTVSTPVYSISTPSKSSTPVAVPTSTSTSAPVYGPGSTSSGVSSAVLPTASSSSASSSSAPATSVVYTTFVSTVVSCAPTVTNCPASSTALVTVSSVVSVTSAVKPTASSSSSTSPATTTTTVPKPPAPPADCPPVVPMCLSTWMFLTECDENTDSDCYCPNREFAMNVFTCIDSWVKEEESCEAYKFFLGICGAHIKENPTLILELGKRDQCGNTPTKPGATTTAPALPSTVIQITSTVTVPCTYSTGSLEGQPIPSSYTPTVIKTSITIPQVVFTTATASVSGSRSVDLVGGQPTTPATQPTPATPLAPTTLGTVVPPVATATPSTTAPLTFEGAGVRVGSSAFAVVAGLAMAVFAM